VAGIEFGVLGPLMVRRGNVPVTIASQKQRAVLSALVLRLGRVVTVQELAWALWGYEPPPSARTTIQNYVLRLRRILACPGPEVIVTAPGGYLIRADAGALDVSRFENLLADARAAARDRSWDVAAARAGEALALWRGEPLADAGSQFLAAREGPWLAEMRLQAVEAHVEARLHLGRGVEAIAELRHLVREHPLRERLHGQLMLALHRCGRRAEALDAYQHARRVVVEELGAEPGAELRELHQRMLADDPTLRAPVPEPPARPGRAGHAVPRELPGTVPHFRGRACELAALTRLLDHSHAGTPGTVLISLIAGTPGVGKTALAVQWAHQIADRFPGGQLYVDLRGCDPGQPVPASEALAGFLRSLGVPVADIPATGAQRAAWYRSLLAARRMLVVLDNAASEEQVRPLLPGVRNCAVVITSRNALPGLVARDGARQLTLDLLPPGDAAGLLRALLGRRADAEPGAVMELAAQCARLPLALRLAAQLAAARPATSLAQLAVDLSDLGRRLDLLDAGGDPRTSVRAVFSWSYRQLDAPAARGFRLLGLHPGPDMDIPAAAALTGVAAGAVTRLIGRLAQAHLIQAAGPDRYGMHDLLRAYAAEQAALQDKEQDRREALARLFGHRPRRGVDLFADSLTLIKETA
jgi:DNA-binding SARP family transcriptional activator